MAKQRNPRARIYKISEAVELEWRVESPGPEWVPGFRLKQGEHVHVMFHESHYEWRIHGSGFTSSGTKVASGPRGDFTEAHFRRVLEVASRMFLLEAIMQYVYSHG